MRDHLPECPHSEPGLSPGFLVICICSKLRACEERVIDAAVHRMAAVIAELREISHD